MALEPFHIGLDRDRAVPGGSLRGAEFKHIGLGAGDGVVDPVGSVGHVAGGPEAPPAEVQPGEILPHPGRFLRRMLDDLFLEFLGGEDIEGIAAGEEMPAEMRLGCALGVQRRGDEFAADAVLRIRNIDAVRFDGAFGAVEIAVLEAAVVDRGDLVGDLILQ